MKKTKKLKIKIVQKERNALSNKLNLKTICKIELIRVQIRDTIKLNNLIFIY